MSTPAELPELYPKTAISQFHRNSRRCPGFYLLGGKPVLSSDGPLTGKDVLSVLSIARRKRANMLSIDLRS
jgi:hypothetical protein